MAIEKESEQQHELAWQAGYDAGIKLENEQPCPYLDDSSLAAAWRRGLIEGREYRKQQTGS